MNLNSGIFDVNTHIFIRKSLHFGEGIFAQYGKPHAPLVRCFLCKKSMNVTRSVVRVRVLYSMMHFALRFKILEIFP